MGTVWAFSTSRDDVSYRVHSARPNFEKAMRIPNEWTFQNESVAAAFDQHVRQQLPWYDMATWMVAQIARHYIPDGGRVYDIGASNGNVGRAIAPVLKSRNAELFAIDNSLEMISRYKGPGELIIGDVSRMGFKRHDVAVCFLALMFLRPQDQISVMERLLMQLRTGGAIIIVEKFEGFGGYTQTAMQRMVHAGKIAMGATGEEVMQKELSLVGVQRPLSPIFARKFLRNATNFFRFGEFAGYVITKQDICRN